GRGRLRRQARGVRQADRRDAGDPARHRRHRHARRDRRPADLPRRRAGAAGPAERGRGHHREVPHLRVGGRVGRLRHPDPGRLRLRAGIRHAALLARRPALPDRADLQRDGAQLHRGEPGLAPLVLIPPVRNAGQTRGDAVTAPHDLTAPPDPDRPHDLATDTVISTVGELLDRRADVDPDRPAVVFTERSLSYAELAEATRRVAGRLVELGMRPGDVLGILSDGDPDTVVALLAAARIGVVCLPVNNRFRAGELRHVIDNGDVRLLLVTPRFRDEIRAALPGLPSLDDLPCADVRIPEAPVLRHVADLADTAGRAAPMTAGQDAGNGAANAVARFRSRVTGDTELVMIYTSGTTA